MKRLVLSGALAIGMLMACYSSADSFSQRLSRLVCINVEECFPDEFGYDSISSCTHEVSTDFENDVYGCSYDPQRGRDCIHALYARRKDCSLIDEIPLSECAGVFFCPQSAVVDGSLSGWFTHASVAPELPVDGVPLADVEEIGAD